LRCEIEIEDRTRTVLSRGVLIDPAFDFSSDTLLTGLTGYWQTTIGWVNDRVSAPEELGPRNRFGFLFVEDGSFRRLRFRANPGDEGSLDNTVPTLAIEQTFEQQVTAERTRITSTRDIEFFQFGCDVSDPLCFDWQLRIWTPIAFRDNFLFVLEDQSFPNFDLFGSTYDESTGVYTRDGVEVDPTERFNQIWPRINVYYFDVVPPWPWAAQTDNSCGTSEVPDGRLDALNECQPRLLDREELFELPAPAEEGLAIDLDSDGVDEVVVADADGDVVRFDLQSGAPTAVATVNEECCAVAIVRTRSTGSTDPEFSVALAGATPRLLTCDGSLTCTRFSLPAGPVAAATLDVDSVHTLAVATDANRIQLYSASAGGFVAGADIGVNAVAALAGGDVNNDGIDDLVVGESSGDVVVLAGEAGGTFSELARTALASIPTSLAVVDLGNDDRNELVTLTPDGVFIYPKLTSLGFALPVAQDAFGENLTFGDFNGDGLLDAAAATRFEVQVLPGAMSQGLGAEISHPRGNSDVVTGLVGNFNADSELDYVVLTVDGQLEVLLGAVTD
ncbi:MAG: VCBS repeat-containing protein, partial [Myxococcota bacterium]